MIHCALQGAAYRSRHRCLYRADTLKTQHCLNPTLLSMRQEGAPFIHKVHGGA